MITGKEDQEMADTPPKYGRGFYWFWFILFTVVSMAMNSGHAAMYAPIVWNSTLDTSVKEWIGVASEAATDASSYLMPTWFAFVGAVAALIPPIALACATHAMVKPDPHTTRFRVLSGRAVTGTIALFSFIMSTWAMTGFIVTLWGVGTSLAVLMPFMIDVSIIGAIIKLEVRREGHQVEAHIPDEPVIEPSTEHSEPSAEPVTEPSVSPSTEPSVRVDGGVNERPVSPSTKPSMSPQRVSVSPSVEPSAVALATLDEARINEAAVLMTAENLIRDKEPEDYVKITRALINRQSPNAIRKAFGYSPESTKKVVAWLTEWIDSTEPETESESREDVGDEFGSAAGFVLEPEPEAEPEPDPELVPAAS